MKKLELERMQRLEEIVERQTKEIEAIIYAKQLTERDFLKLQGANEALVDLIIRLKEGPIQITKVQEQDTYFGPG